MSKMTYIASFSQMSCPKPKATAEQYSLRGRVPHMRLDGSVMALLWDGNPRGAALAQGQSSAVSGKNCSHAEKALNKRLMHSMVRFRSAMRLVSISVSLLQGLFQAQESFQNCKRSITHSQYQIAPSKYIQIEKCVQKFNCDHR